MSSDTEGGVLTRPQVLTNWSCWCWVLISNVLHWLVAQQDNMLHIS